MVFVFKFQADVMWHVAIQKIGNQGLAKPGARAFVAQNKTQAVLTGVNIFAIKKRNIGTRAKHTAKAFLMPASGISATQQIAVDTYVRFREELADGIADDLVPVGA